MQSDAATSRSAQHPGRRFLFWSCSSLVNSCVHPNQPVDDGELRETLSFWTVATAWQASGIFFCTESETDCIQGLIRYRVRDPMLGNFQLDKLLQDSNPHSKLRTNWTRGNRCHQEAWLKAVGLLLFSWVINHFATFNFISLTV